MHWIVIAAVLPSLLVSWLAGYAVIRWAPAWGLVDVPGGRKLHRRPTPLGGGLAIALGIALPLAVGSLAVMQAERNSAQRVDHFAAQRADMEHEPLDDAQPTVERAPPAAEGWGDRCIDFVRPHLAGLTSRLPDLWLLLAAAGALVVLGLADDLGGVDWRVRLAIQTLVALGIVWGRGWQVTLFVNWPLLTGGLTVLWIVGLVNSFNLLDNMDGLSAGVATIAAVFLTLILLVEPPTAGGQPQLFVAGLACTVIGSLLGFLAHNLPPARLFMGDAGSYLVGFLLAMTTILATFAGCEKPWHAVLAPVCLLAVPIYDTVSVVLIRICEGRSPFSADRCHVSHRLVDLGMTREQAVLTIYAATAVCGCAALALYRVGNLGAVAIGAGLAALVGLAATLELRARRGVELPLRSPDERG